MFIQLHINELRKHKQGNQNAYYWLMSIWKGYILYASSNYDIPQKVNGYWLLRLQKELKDE